MRSYGLTIHMTGILEIETSECIETHEDLQCEDTMSEKVTAW